LSMAASPRFQVELEFVQALANVHYVAHLSDQGTLYEEEFVAFLAYLQYWHRPEYTHFIEYPQCLCMLDLLQRASFREALRNPEFVRYVLDQQDLHWKYRASANTSTEGESLHGGQ